MTTSTAVWPALLAALILAAGSLLIALTQSEPSLAVFGLLALESVFHTIPEERWDAAQWKA